MVGIKPANEKKEIGHRNNKWIENQLITIYEIVSKMDGSKFVFLPLVDTFWDKFSKK